MGSQMCFCRTETVLRTSPSGVLSVKNPAFRGACGDLDGASPPNEDSMHTAERFAPLLCVHRPERASWAGILLRQGSALEATNRPDWMRPPCPDGADQPFADWMCAKGLAPGDDQPSGLDTATVSSVELDQPSAVWKRVNGCPFNRHQGNGLGYVGSRRRKGGR